MSAFYLKTTWNYWNPNRNHSFQPLGLMFCSWLRIYFRCFFYMVFGFSVASTDFQVVSIGVFSYHFLWFLSGFNWFQLWFFFLPSKWFQNGFRFFRLFSSDFRWFPTGLRFSSRVSVFRGCDWNPRLLLTKKIRVSRSLISTTLKLFANLTECNSFFGEPNQRASGSKRAFSVRKHRMYLQFSFL